MQKNVEMKDGLFTLLGGKNMHMILEMLNIGNMLKKRKGAFEPVKKEQK